MSSRKMDVLIYDAINSTSVILFRRSLLCVVLTKTKTFFAMFFLLFLLRYLRIIIITHFLWLEKINSDKKIRNDNLRLWQIVIVLLRKKKSSKGFYDQLSIKEKFCNSPFDKNPFSSRPWDFICTLNELKEAKEDTKKNFLTVHFVCDLWTQM